MSKGGDRTVFVLPDQHFAPAGCPEGGVDKRALNCAIEAIGITQPDVFVNIGDVGEWASVSPWQYKKKARPPLTYVLKELAKEAKAVNAGLDLIDATLAAVGCKEKHMIEGNHEVWLDNLVEELEELEPLYSPRNLMKLDERGYTYHPYGEYVKFGKLNIYHGGHFATQHHTNSHLVHCKDNVMYGHTHSVQSQRAASLDGDYGAWNIGCICKLNKKFIKGRPTSWSHAFAIVHLRKGGTFTVEVIDIINGRCKVWGRDVRG